MTTQRKVRIGLVGAGFIGQVAHLSNLSQIHNCEIVGLAEMRAELGRAVQKKYSIPYLFYDHRQLIDSGLADGLVVVTRRTQTGQIVFDALTSGLHVLSEKPMAQTSDKANLLTELAKKNSLIYSIGFMRRYDPAIQMAKSIFNEFSDNGKLGRPLLLRAYLTAGGDYCGIDGDIKSNEPKPPDGDWPSYPSWLNSKLGKAYEHFVNLCSHDINLIRFITDETPGVNSVFYNPGRGTVINFDFKNFPGTFTWVDNLSQNRWEEGIVIDFEKGSIKLSLSPAFLRNQPSKLEILDYSAGKTGQILEPLFDWSWSFANEDQAFVNSIEHNIQTISSGHESVEDFLIIDKIWKKINSN